MAKIIIASGPVIIEDGRVLLNKHGEDDFWKFCGGRIEEDEASLEEAAARELKEEMGLGMETIDPKPYLFYAEKETADGKMSVILAHFLAKRKGEIKPGAEIREWRWLDREELGKEKLAPNIRPALEHFHFLD